MCSSFSVANRRPLPAVLPPGNEACTAEPVGTVRLGPKATRVVFSFLPTPSAGMCHLSWNSHFKARGTARLCGSSRASQALCSFHTHTGGVPRPGREPCAHSGASARGSVAAAQCGPLSPRPRALPYPSAGPYALVRDAGIRGLPPTLQTQFWLSPVGAWSLAGPGPGCFAAGRLEDGGCVCTREHGSWGEGLREQGAPGRVPDGWH